MLETPSEALHQVGMDEVLFKCAVCGQDWLFNPLMFKDDPDPEKRKIIYCPGPLMKLSEAIRLGSQLHPQRYGLTFDYSYDDKGKGRVIGSCPFGAAYVVLVGEPIPYSLVFPDVIKVLGTTLGIDFAHTFVQHPATYEREQLDEIIVNLNDTYEWTRERIADWLESIGF